MADNYTVGTGRQDTVLDPDGHGFKSVWEYPVKVTDGPSKGTTFTVTVDASDHSADAVHSAITAELKTIDEIHTR
jgi:hypothetical protein